MPDRDQIAYATFQVFRNQGSKQLAEWVLKIRAADVDDFAVTDAIPRLREFYVSLRPGGARRLRSTIRSWITKGRLSEEFAERFDAITASMHSKALMGLVSRSAVIGHKPQPGQNANSRLVHDDQFAVMRLTEDKSAPREIKLWLGAGQPPLVITDFKAADDRSASGHMREDRAAGWYAYHDPENVMLGLRQDARALAAHNRKQAELRDWHPMSAIASLMQAVTTPLLERIEQLEATVARMRGMQ